MKPMASESLVNRLEAAVAQIEALVPKLGAKARGGGGGGDDEDDVPEYVTEWQALRSGPFNAVVEAASKVGLSLAKDALEGAYGNLDKIIRANVACKKPQPAEWGALLSGASGAIKTLDGAAFKRPKRGQPDFKEHYTGLKEFVTAFNWVTMVPPQLPVPFIESQEGSVMFNFNKILRKAKDAANGDDLRSLVKVTQAAVKGLYAYVKQNFKTGLEWNPKGKSVADFTPGAPTAKAAAPAEDEKTQEEEVPKPKPKKKKAGGGGGMASVFGQLGKKGSGMGTHGSATSAFGLKKVTKSMQTHKNKDLRKTGDDAVIKAAGAKKKGPKKKAAAKPKKERPPRAEIKGSRWFVENYKNNVTFQMPEDQVKVIHTVFISNCESACIVVPGKVKSVLIDNCKKCKIFVNEVISSVELVNTNSTTVIIQGKAPSIAVDKSKSPRIVLLRPAYEAKPAIITSNISAMNIEIPGATDEDDTIEIAVPEQFISHLNLETKKLITEEVKHG